MFEALEQGLGLDIVIGLQSMGSPALDALALLLYLVGGFVFYLAVATFYYWSVDKGLGKRLLLVLLVTGVLIAGFKLAFERPRPYITAPDRVSHVIEERTYGFPSGHTAFALAWWGYLAWQARSRVAWAAVLGYTALMGWARMYIGAHYPQDIAGGLVAGILALAICTRFPSGVVSAWNWLPLAVRAGAILVMSIVITLSFGEDNFALVVAGVVPGASLGAYIEGKAVRFSTAGSPAQRLTRCVFGALLLVSLFVLLWVAPLLPEMREVRQALIYAVIGAGVTVGWPWLGLRLGFFSRALAGDNSLVGEG
jgi:membrane-associated phospholipid phosphatase